MTPLLDTVLPLAPHSKGRPRMSFRGGRPRAHTPPETEAWERAAEWHLRSAIGHRWTPVDVPVRVEVIAVEARTGTRPKGVAPAEWKAGQRTHRIGKRDTDNELKAALDALTRAGFWTDDNLVVDVRGVKLWAAVGEAPCVEVRVWSVAEK